MSDAHFTPRFTPSPDGLVAEFYRHLAEGSLHVERLGRGTAWLDTGTPDALLQAANFIQALQQRQGLKIACLEEIAWENHWIDAATLERQITRLGKTPYADYLQRRLHDETR